MSESTEALVLRAQRGDHAARGVVVQSMVSFVRLKVNRQERPDLRDDLMQVGLMAIDRSIDTFDGSRGAKFLTYAAHQVRHALQYERRTQDSDGFTGRNIRRQLQVLRGNTSQCRTPAEAERLRAVPACLRGSSAPPSLAIGSEAETVDALDARTRSDDLHAAVSQLPIRQREVIRLQYLEDSLSVRQIAERMGLSHETVYRDSIAARRALAEALG